MDTLKVAVLTNYQLTIIDQFTHEQLFIYRSIPEPQKCLNLHPMFDIDAFPIVMFSNVENAESGIQIDSLTNKF